MHYFLVKIKVIKWNSTVYLEIITHPLSWKELVFFFLITQRNSIGCDGDRNQNL